MAESDKVRGKRRQPAFSQALVAGAASGFSVDLLFYPIDTIKTRLQSAQGFVRAGGFKGVYKGVGSVGVGSAPGAAAFFTGYEGLKKVLGQGGQENVFVRNPGLCHMVSASGGELLACLIRVPTEVVKSRAQLSSYGAKKGAFGSAKELLRLEGIKGFYRGFGITMVREIPFTSIQFPVYEKLKSLYSQKYLDGQRAPAAPAAAVCGMIAGGIAAFSTTPLDVVKTRVMLEARDPTNPSATRAAAAWWSIPSRLSTIAANEGRRALFRGGLPRTLWISAGGAIFLGVYEQALDVVGVPRV